MKTSTIEDNMVCVPDDAPIFTRKLSLLIERSGMKVKEAAQGAEIGVRSFYDMMSKGTLPRAHPVAKLAKLFNVPTDYLADDDIPVEPVPAGPLSLFEPTDIHKESATRYAQGLVRTCEAIRGLLSEDLAGMALRHWKRGLNTSAKLDMLGELKHYHSMGRGMYAMSGSGGHTAADLKKIAGIDANPEEYATLHAQLLKAPGYVLLNEYVFYHGLVSRNTDDAQTKAILDMAPAKLEAARELAKSRPAKRQFKKRSNKR